MNPTLEALYRAAIQADDQFQAAVVRQFGAKDAGDARYQYRTFNPATQRSDDDGNTWRVHATGVAGRSRDGIGAASCKHCLTSRGGQRKITTMTLTIETKGNEDLVLDDGDDIGAEVRAWLRTERPDDDPDDYCLLVSGCDELPISAYDGLLVEDEEQDYLILTYSPDEEYIDRPKKETEDRFSALVSAQRQGQKAAKAEEGETLVSGWKL